MSGILAPDRSAERIWKKDISYIEDLTSNIFMWHSVRGVSQEGRSLSRIWYRGNSKSFDQPLTPKVCRESFISTAKTSYPPRPAADATLTLERMLLKEFRTAGAVHFDASDIVEVYFTAQHFGMPTRLLDWTMNPLIGLFFAVQERQHLKEDGELFVMDAIHVLPDIKTVTISEAYTLPVSILTMRDSRTVESVGDSFSVYRSALPTFADGMTPTPLILPVRPDNRPGRIGQQSSCFTLHEVGCADFPNPTLDKFIVKADAKERLLNELRRLNVNEYAIFNSLDHLSSTICAAWGV
jgi:FRG domain